MKRGFSALCAASCMLGLALSFASCGSDGGGSGGGAGGSSGSDAGGAAGTDGGLGCTDCPAPVCNAGTKYAAGTQAFVDRTAEWGLTGIEGQRINVADFDGDGWADLAVRRAAIAADDFNPGGKRGTFILRNGGSKSFSDVTQQSGILAMRTDTSGSKGRPGQIYAFADVDNDGDQDAFVALDTTDAAKSLGESSELMLNDGTGKFALGPEGSQARAAGEVSHPAAAVFVDVDRDGALDLWVPQNSYSPTGFAASPQQDRLYRGDGAGSFTLATDALGLTSAAWGDFTSLNEGRAHTNAWSGLACDLNGDGTPELLAASYGRAPNHLWVGAGAGAATTFTNRAVASGYAFDGNQDWKDNQFARCYCSQNPTAEDCAGVAAPQISCTQINWNHTQDRQAFRLGGNSSSTFCADLDNDGDMDLLTGEIRHWWAGQNADGSEVLVNTGEAEVRFERPGDAALGLEVKQSSVSWDEGHMTNAVFDFDNDGWPDIYVGASDYPGNHGLLYHQASKLSFLEVPIADGIDHNRSHGAAFADFDHDGDLDVVVGHSRARCDATAPNNCYDTANVRLFENVLGDKGNFIQLSLVGGTGSNRSAVGARVTVEAGGVTQTQEVGGGFGHYGAQNDMVLHFGLGAACDAKVTVRWPNAELTTHSYALPAGHRFLIEQGMAAKLDPKFKK